MQSTSRSKCVYTILCNEMTEHEIRVRALDGKELLCSERLRLRLRVLCALSPAINRNRKSPDRRPNENVARTKQRSLAGKASALENFRVEI